jgi:hypothetical protein
LINGSNDPTLSASLAGILFAHGVLDGRQRATADRFRRARAACFGVVLPSDDPNRPTGDEEQAARNAVRYDRLLALLDRDQRRAVIGLALDQRRPCCARPGTDRG